MKLLNLALAGAASALAISTIPVLAHAQSAYDYGVDASANLSDHAAWRLTQRQELLATRLRVALRNDAIDATQYRRLRNELSGVRDELTTIRARQDGVLTDEQVALLNDRMNAISDRLGSLSDRGYPY